MSIRKQALENRAFAALKRAYDNRDEAALAWKRQGKQVVGMLGYDVPQELLIAADLLPAQVAPTVGGSTEQADRYLEMSFRTTSKLCFEKLVDGTYGAFMDHLAISNSSDQFVRLYLYLRELRRVEPEKPIPEVELVDWLFSRNLMYQLRNERTIRTFWETVERWAGRTISEEDYQRGVRICNENRALLRAVTDLRRGEIVRLTGSEALVIYGASLYMEKQAHSALVRELLEEAVHWPAVEGKRLFFSGTDQDSTDFYEMAEADGAVIVGEDHAWGERLCQRDVDPAYSPVRGIVDRYMLRTPSIQKANISQRVAALDSAVSAARAQGVLLASQKYEDAISWDYPEQKKVLDARGIPSVRFRNLHWPLTENEGLDAAVRAFVDSI